jgi:hypothetical protein
MVCSEKSMPKIKLRFPSSDTFAASHPIETAKQDRDFNNVPLDKFKVILHLIGVQGSGVVFSSFQCVMAVLGLTVIIFLR